jgi:hypothetical protein
MSGELDRILERTRQNRQAREATVSRETEAVGSRPVVSGSTLRAGDRVFDLVSGQEGVVIGDPPVVVNGSTLVHVRLDVSGLVMRLLEQLVPRPTPPTGQ